MKPRVLYLLAASALMLGQVDAAELSSARQAFLGIMTEALPRRTNSSDALQLKLSASDGGGLFIRWIAGGSPASKVLQEGDVLLVLNGEPLVTSAQLGTLVQSLKPGDSSILKVLRAMEALELEVFLATRPSSIDPPPFTYFERPDLLSLNADDPVYDPIEQLSSSSPPPRRVWTADQYNHEPGKSPAVSTGQWLRRYCITSTAGRRTLTITDRHDHVLFSGPVDSIQERAAVPRKFRAGLNKVEVVPPELVIF